MQKYGIGIERIQFYFRNKLDKKGVLLEVHRFES